MASDSTLTQYPRTVALPDQTKIQLRLMSAVDRDAVLTFARALPQEDLLFLRVDLTEAAVVDEWMANLERGNSTSLAAYDGEQLVGYSTVHRNAAPWTRRVGEIRVNVSPDFRARGLGRALTSHIFDIARDMGLRKLTAQMTSDQQGAQAAFRHLGFVPEAILADYVEDRNGTVRDMVIMSFDIDGLTDQAMDRLQL